MDATTPFSPAATAQDEANPRGGFGRFAQILLPLEYTGWVDESQAHIRSCYLGDWTSLHKVSIRGRQALEFLSRLGMNDLSRFALGQIKHHVQLDENGWIASEGVLCRLGEEEFVYTAGSCDWLMWQFTQGGWDAQVADVSADWFIFGVQGPTSLLTLERATGEGLRDIAFNRSRHARIDGTPVRVLRTGISGELGYEVHGPAGAANEIWSAVAAAGEPFGLRLLGFRSQPVQHIEAGIATNGLDYLPASILTPGAPTQFRRGTIGGSFVPADGITDYFRRPAELGWARPGRIGSHDFLGREALAAADAAAAAAATDTAATDTAVGDTAAADAATGRPSRTLVGLRWHPADVAAILAAPLAEGELPDQMDVPRLLGPSFDQVLAAGRPIGVSTGRTLSPHLRATISLCVIEHEHATPGTDVTVLWGRPGTPQREIRATVTALPFKPDRRRTDVTAL